MGLSSKQVSSDGLDWTQNLLLQNGGLELPKPPQARQQHEQQSSPLRCPRCDSTNTKFCYYNNYNRLQPRHFCKACRRHWTKGGTLRNVPVGGGRKNKRLKTTKNDQNNNNNNTPNIQVIQQQQQQQQQLQQLPVEFGHQKNISNVLYRALLQSPPPPTPLLPNYINSTTTTTTTTNDNSNASSSSSSMNCFAASPLLLRRPLPPLPQFPTFTTMSSLESDPSSSSFAGHSQFYSNYAASTAEDTLFDSQLSPWQIPTTSSYLDSTHWNWEDLSLFISPDPKKRPPPPPEDSQFSLLGM